MFVFNKAKNQRNTEICDLNKHGVIKKVECFMKTIFLLKKTSALNKLIRRREILDSENRALIQNSEALDFIKENGPDTLINCISINFRTWDKNRYSYTLFSCSLS
jgi:hypothetical protein